MHTDSLWTQEEFHHPFPEATQNTLTKVRPVQKPLIPQPFSPFDVDLNAVTPHLNAVAFLALDSETSQDAPNATICPRRTRNHLNYRV